MTSHWVRMFCLGLLVFALSALPACGSGGGEDGCVRDSECEEGKICRNGVCVETGDPCALVVCDAGFRCQDGECVPVDPCADIVCDSPPADAQCHVVPGTCTAGSCSYDSVSDQTACDDGDSCTENDACNQGLCEATAMVCDSPPDPECADGMTRRTYGSEGSCSAGACSYPHQDETCDFGCADGLCQPEGYCPDLGVTRCVGDVVESCTDHAWQMLVDCSEGSQVCYVSESVSHCGCVNDDLRCRAEWVEQCQAHAWVELENCGSQGWVCLVENEIPTCFSPVMGDCLLTEECVSGLSCVSLWGGSGYCTMLCAGDDDCTGDWAESTCMWEDAGGSFWCGPMCSDGQPGSCPTTGDWSCEDATGLGDLACIHACLPECADKECGGDGCGASCGDCVQGWSCLEGSCVEEPELCPVGQACENLTGEILSCLEGGWLPINSPSCRSSLCPEGMQCWAIGSERRCIEACGVCPEGLVCNNLSILSGIDSYGCLTPDGFIPEDTPACDPQTYQCPGNRACYIVGGNQLVCMEQCSAPHPVCVPDCTGKECGDDGCGGSCGTCDLLSTCEAGTCEVLLCPVGQECETLPDLGPLTFCTEEGGIPVDAAPCSGDGDCPFNSRCLSSPTGLACVEQCGLCSQDLQCTPIFFGSISLNFCMDSGEFPSDLQPCETIDECPRGHQCVVIGQVSECLAMCSNPHEACLPDCQDKRCGPDGCGGLCGVCLGDLNCVAGACMPVSPVD